MKPKISICAPAIRIHLWKNFAKSLLSNTIPYEIIFVGNVEPTISIKEYNIQWIYSNVKPAQCTEIALRKAEGELLNLSADESIYEPKSLDIIYEYHKSQKKKKLITGFTTWENNGSSFSLTSGGHRISGKDSPQMACFWVMENNYFKELGGYDRRFITGQSENDLCMRNYEAGGDLLICPDARVNLYHNLAHQDNMTDSKFRKWLPQNREFLEKCWINPDGTVSHKRLIPFEPFLDENILTVSQPPVGEW